MTYTLHRGDCLETLRGMPDNSVDSIVTDPPYGLSKEPDADEVLRHWLNGDDYLHTGGGFMGKKWDSFVPGPNTWREALRVLKPGSHALVFAGTRTQDLMSMALRLAGFEVRDVAMWLYGSGFPKSLDVSKAVEKAAGIGASRERALKFTAWMRSTGITIERLTDALTLVYKNAGTAYTRGREFLHMHQQGPAIPTLEAFAAFRHLVPEPPAEIMELMQWRTIESENMKRREVIGQRTTGIGTGGGSTPIMGDSDNRDITTPHTEQAKQWEGWGTALKPAYEPIIIARKPLAGTVADTVLAHGVGAINVGGCRIPSDEQHRQKCASVVGLDSRRNNVAYSAHNAPRNDSYNAAGRFPANILHDGILDSENWGRYFYCAKASKQDRNEGCDHLEAVSAGEATGGRAEGSDGLNSPRAGAGRTSGARNHHPTVKPVDLMRYLCRLVTPPGGQVLDMFAGSGSTGKAAILEGFTPILCELTPEYWPIIEARCDWAEWQRLEEIHKCT